jgi:mannosyltransferase OCH1-like enzyme
MDIIYYMWGFKPREMNSFPKDVIQNNKRFISNHKIIFQDDIQPFIKDNTFPKLSKLAERIPHWVIEADLGRLLQIYFHGGVYFDADCFMMKDIEMRIISFCLLNTYVQPWTTWDQESVNIRIT